MTTEVLPRVEDEAPEPAASSGEQPPDEVPKAARPVERGFRREHVSDLALSLALTMIALWGWQSTFQGLGLWIFGASAALLGMAIAAVVVDLRGNMWVVTALLLVGYYVVSAPIAVGLDVFEGTTWLTQGIAGSIDAWPLMLVTHAPVDAEGRVMLAPVAMALASAGLATGFSARTRHPTLPVLPPTLAFGGILVFAQAEPVDVLLQGLAFGGGALVWMRIRGLRLDASKHGRDPAWRWRVFAGSCLIVAGALVTGLLIGAPNAEDRFVLRRTLPGYEVTDIRTPLDNFRDYTKRPGPSATNRYSRGLLDVTGAPEGARIRFVTLDQYDGRHWYADNDTDRSTVSDRFLRMGTELDNPAEGGLISVTVDPTEWWTLPWVPVIGDLQSFALVEPERSDARASLRFDPATRTGVMTDRLEPDDAYRFSARLGSDRLRERMGERMGDRMGASRLVDEDLFERAAFLDDPVVAWSMGARTRIEALFQVAAALRRTGFYSDGVDAGEARFGPGQTELRLGKQFALSDPTVGNDEQYAATMALMANRLRVPARVVVGAVVPSGGVVRGKDVEAWVEVRVGDDTWRTLETSEFMSQRPPPPPGQLPKRNLPRVFPSLQAEHPPQQPDFQEPPPKPDPAVGVIDQGIQLPWKWLVLLLALLVVGASPTLKWWRRRRRLRASRVSLRYAGAWLELVDHARDLGVSVPPSLTRPGQARALSRGVDLAWEADRSIFDGVEPSRDEASDYWARVRRERADLRSSVSPWRRVWAVFSTASLRR